jgi:hypothetical protein
MIQEEDAWSPFKEKDKGPEYIYENRHIQW